MLIKDDKKIRQDVSPNPAFIFVSPYLFTSLSYYVSPIYAIH